MSTVRDFREKRVGQRALPFVTLFFSLSTLLCCALPALFVALGFGATFVSLLGAFPQLIWFSEHKTPIFIVSAFLLGGTWLARRIAPQECPADPALAAACARARRLSSIIFGISVAAFVVGGFFAFIAPLL